MVKVIILGIFVVFGMGVMFGDPNWQTRFFDDFAPNGPLRTHKQARAEQIITESLEGNDYERVERSIVEGSDAVGVVLAVADGEESGSDLVVVGAKKRCSRIC